MTRSVAQVLAAIFSGLLLLAALLYPFTLISVSAPAPCTQTSEILIATRLLLMSALVVSGVWMRRARPHPSMWDFIGAAGLVLVAVGFSQMANKYEADRQKSCAKRNLSEAMAACRAQSAHYRQGRDQNGSRTLTLMAPGTTDHAWNCLMRWGTHNGSVSLLVDESVYEQYRRTHPRR